MITIMLVIRMTKMTMTMTMTMTMMTMFLLFSAASAKVDHRLPQLLLAYASVIVVVKHPDNQPINGMKAIKIEQ